MLLMAITAFPTVAQVPFADQAAQSDRAGDSPATKDKTERVEALGKQLGSLLESGTLEQQSAAMTIIINLRRQRPDAYDFGACTSPLMQIYRSAQKAEMRLLALAALDAIGTSQAYEALGRAVENVRSRRIRRQTALVLKHAEADEPAS